MPAGRSSGSEGSSKLRLFVAVIPPPAVLDVVAGLERPDIPGARWTSRDQWHVTLRFLGSVHAGELGAVRAAIDGMALPPPRVVTLGPETGCFGRTVLHVPASGLEALAAATVQATARFGEPPGGRPFAGHLTLARSRPRGADLRRLAGMPLAASWAPADLTVVRSHLGAPGARYEVVHRRPLGRGDGRRGTLSADPPANVRSKLRWCGPVPGPA